MPAAWPKVQQALVAQLRDLPAWAGVEVSDGPPVDREAPYRYCAVGTTVEDDSGGAYERTNQLEGAGWAGAVRESGRVQSELEVAAEPDPDNPDALTDLAAVRTEAFELVDAWEAALAADPTLGGVLGQLGTVELSVDVQPMQTDQGALQRLVVTVAYSTFT